MNIDPIQEKTSLINKLIGWAKNLFKKEPNYEKIIQASREAAYQNYELYRKYGMSCEQAAKSMKKCGDAIAKFNKVMTPNQMREILGLDSETTTLYADNKAYCILNKKGDPIWLDKIK